MTIQSRPVWISTLMQIILVMCISSPGCVTSNTFVSTPAHKNGVLTTCVGERISFTCSHAGEETSTTAWEFSPPRATSCSSLIDHQNAVASRQCDPFTFQDISNTTQEILTSTAVTTANTSLIGTVLECADGTGNMAIQIGSNISICVVALPSNLVIDGSRLFWSGTTCVSTTITYEVTVSGPQTMVSNVTSGTSTTLSTLQPNQRYTVSVKAFGSSCSTQAAITSFVTTTNGGPTADTPIGTGAHCVEPDPPINGNIDYSPGLSVTVQCNSGFVPQEPVTATCQTNGSWSPNPAEHMCYECNTCNQHVLATVLTSVTCSAVFFVLGGVAGMLCLYCLQRYKQSQGQDVAVQPPIPVYEDVNLPTIPRDENKEDIKFNQNVCYESMLTNR